MTIKEAAARTGLTEKTIRYYEAQGFIHPSTEEKNGRNFRAYSEENVQELKNIAVLRKMRFTIEEIRKLQQGNADTAEILTVYRHRIEREMKEISEIYELTSGMNMEEMHSIAEIAAKTAADLKKASLPQTDIAPDFGHIVFYLIEKEHTFTEICHYCIAQGITRDSRAVRKAVNKMKRRKIISEKNGMCRALIDGKNIKVEDIERMVQIASTGSGDLLFVYNWNPPGGVSSMPYTGI